MVSARRHGARNSSAETGIRLQGSCARRRDQPSAPRSPAHSLVPKPHGLPPDGDPTRTTRPHSDDRTDRSASRAMAKWPTGWTVGAAAIRHDDPAAMTAPFGPRGRRPCSHGRMARRVIRTIRCKPGRLRPITPRSPAHQAGPPWCDPSGPRMNRAKSPPAIRTGIARPSIAPLPPRPEGQSH